MNRLQYPSRNAEQQVLEAPIKTPQDRWNYREILPALLALNQGEAPAGRAQRTRRLPYFLGPFKAGQQVIR